MNAIRKAAPTWRGGHGSETHCASVTNNTHHTTAAAPCQADVLLEMMNAAAELASAQAHAAAVTQQVDALLTTIANARAAAAACLSTDGRAHYRRHAHGAANEAGRLLLVHDKPRPVPLNAGQIRWALATYRKAAAVHLEILANKVEVWAAWLREDGSWEHALFDEDRPLQRLDDWEYEMYVRAWGAERYEDG